MCFHLPQLAIGQMYHCPKRGRGILRRGVPPTNIIFKKSCSYQHMLERCISMLKYDKKDCEFYLADSKGVPIWTANTISMDDDDGEGEIPWTLMNFIRHSNIRYPSKAKLYCVKKGKYTGVYECYPNSLGPEPVLINGLVHFEWTAIWFPFNAHQNRHEYH